jgi:dipeptide/tripeptide permease
MLLHLFSERCRTPNAEFSTNHCTVTPILGAIIADQYIGKYKTILYFCFIYIIGLFILTMTSLPIALQHGAGLGGFIAGPFPTLSLSNGSS